MIAYLPEIYPDELVYSWFCRFAVHSGYISHKQVLQNLYCKKSDTPIKEFIGNLNPEAKSCIQKMYPLEKLVLNHTMYPQYARFIPLEKKKEALHKLCYENCDVHHLFSVLPRCENEQYLKYCPMCVKKDREMYGETYWHRRHQIRNMGICQEHRCVLKNSSVSAKNVGTCTFISAELVIPHTEEIIFAKAPIQIQFAEYMEQVFDAPMDFKKDVTISSVLYCKMKDTEYMKTTGNCRYMRKFVNDIQKFYKEIELNEIASMSQIQRMLLSGNRYDFPVVCQIAFFLKIPVEKLVAPELSEEHIAQEKRSHYIKGNIAPDWEKYDAETALLMETTSSNIYNGVLNEMGKPDKVTERYMCRILGIKPHQLEKMPKCREILKKYEESYPEFWARKIAWAYKFLENNKGEDIIYWSDIRKISGVKKEQVAQALPYLKDYTDEITVRFVSEIILG